MTAPDDPTQIASGMATTDKALDPTADTKYIMSQLTLPHSLPKNAQASSCHNVADQMDDTRMQQDGRDEAPPFVVL